MKAIYTIQNFAKRLVMVLAVGLMALNVWADSYTIEFKDSGSASDGSTARSSLSDIVSSGDTYVSSVSSCSRVYNGKSGYGVKLGANGGTGTFTINISTTGQKKPSKITINAAQYGSDGSDISYQINGGDASTITASGGTTLTDYDINMDGNTTFTSITIASTYKRLYVKSVTVTYSTCDKSVAVTDGGSSTNGSITSITTSPVATCSSTAADRQVSILVTPSTGYVAPTDLTVASSTGTVSATKISRTDNGNGTFTFVYQFAQNNNGSISYNAACVGKQCTVTFDKNSGTGGDNSVTATYGSAMTTITPPTRAHYDFAGYYDSETDNDGTGNKYYNANGTSAATWNKNTTSNTTLYAKWTEHSLTNYRTTCTACEAPNHVDIAGAWDRFAGETISLTATAYSSAGTGSPIDDGDITGYQWYKGGTAEGNKIAGATSATYTKDNCTLADAGDYYCKISTGATCSTMSSSFGVKVYALDCYTGGTATHNFTRVGETQTGTLQLTLTAGTGYEFKVRQGSVYLGNDGTINEDENTWEFTTSGSNVTVNSGLGGTFTFTLDYSSNADEPILAVTYPRKTIYLVPNSDWLSNSAKFAYYYYGASGGTAWTDFIAANECGMSAEIPQWNGITVIAVRFNSTKVSTGNWDDKWNQTDDIELTADKNLITITGWNNSQTYTAYAPTTYQITFAGNGNTGGSMSTVSSIPCGEDRTLAANAFEKTGWTFSHWTANVAVKVGGATVAIGDPIADAATIQDITSDIALTAQWTANKYDVTLKPNEGSGSDQVVQATYGSGMPLTVKTAGTAIVVPTRTGYNFNGYWDDASTGTQYYTYTGSPKTLGSACSWDKTAATNLFAHWIAKQTTVSFNQNGGTGGQTTTKTATYASAMPTPITLPTREGHTFGGYYESAGGTGAQYYTNAGASAKSWDKEDATWTLYAKWTVNSYTLAWDWNGGSTSSTTHTAAGSVAYETTLVYPANNTMSKTGHTFTGWSPNPETMPAEATTITAQWSVNSYNVAVQTISYVTIKATPDGGSAITEGNNDDVAYNTTITLNHGSVTTGHGQWGGWRVTKAGDPSVVVFSGTANNATFPMPDYAITVTAYLYSDAIAWCDPDVTVTGDVHLTSTKDVYVNTTSGAGNLLNVASTDLGSATSMDIAYLNADAADAEVDKAASAFRLYASDASAAIDVSSSSVDISAARTFDTDYSMRYTPTAYSQYNNYKLQLTFKKGDKVLKTVKKPIYGRGLPEEFVIAVKKGDIWVALPNDLATTSAQPAIVPLPITVDNTTTPTEAVYTPINTVYKAMNRGNDEHISTIRFTTTGSNYLQVSGSSEYNMWLSTSNSPNVQDWQLKSSDNSAYELTIPSNSTTKKMGIYNSTYMGYHGSPNNAEIYILPITNKIIELPATVTEWGQKSLVLDVNAASYASAQAHIGNGAIEEATSFAQTCTSVKGSPSTNNYTLSFSTTDFSENKGALLYIDWLDGGGDVQSTSTLTIPWIIATNSTMGVIDNVQAHWKDWEVHVLPGVTLEADGNSFSAASNVAKVKTLEIYPGAIVKVTSGTLDVTNDLILRYGWTRAGSKNYSVAQMQIKRGEGGANLTTNHVYADWYIDYDQYYSISVPWKVTVANITYLNSANAASGGMKLRYYDGEQRASTGQTMIGQNWKEYSPLPTYLEPSKGYALSARRPTGRAFSILRMPLTIPSSSWTALGEQGEVSGTHKDQVSVTGWGYDTADWYAMGWNFIGNPYMSTFNGNDAGISGKIEYQDGGSVRYATIPDIDFQNYYQVNIVDANLSPASGFFIQANSASAQNITFSASKIVNPSMPARYLREASIPDQEAYIRLSYEGGKDQMGLIIGEDYTEAYEPNADLAKVLGEGNFVRTYMRYTGMDMAYVAINETLAKEWIPVTVQLPVAGEYTFSLTNSSIVENLEGVYLIDYANEGKVTNLIEEDYIFTAEAGTLTDRFAINGIVGQRNTPEGVDAVDAKTDTTKPVKFMYRDKIYILNQGVIYDATGKKVREINK